MNNELLQLRNNIGFQNKLQLVNSKEELAQLFEEYCIEADNESIFCYIQKIRENELSEQERMQIERMREINSSEINEEELELVSGGAAVIDDLIGAWIIFWFAKGFFDGYNSAASKNKKRR